MEEVHQPSAQVHGQFQHALHDMVVGFTFFLGSFLTISVDLGCKMFGGTASKDFPVDDSVLY
jgi:hypothetical protein